MRHLDRAFNNTLIVAVDFDGTLCEHQFPDIGKPNEELIGELVAFRALGNKLILWTCREGEHLTQAIVWCEEHGLSFDAVNENVPSEFAKFVGAKRKIYAHLYIDDKAVNPESFSILMEEIRTR